MSKQASVIRDMLAPAVRSVGCELWGVEYIAQGKHSLLRVYIDSPDGITVDDCAATSHQVSGVLDVENPIPGEYTLEVSSPGADRPIFELEQFGMYLNAQIQLSLRVPMGNRRKFTGKLLAVGDDTLLFEVDSEQLDIAFANVQKARLVPDFDG